jgi:hypothetical protein
MGQGVFVTYIRQSSDPLAVLSLFEEFIYRQALDIPLSGRNEAELVPVLQFILNNISRPYYAPTLLLVFDRILGTRTCYLEIPNSFFVDLLLKLNRYLRPCSKSVIKSAATAFWYQYSFTQ